MPRLLPYFISYRSSCHKDQKTAIQLPVSSDGYGDIKIHLAEILEEKNISLNQLSFRTEMQRTQLRNYRDNKIQRLDIDILKRLCYVLECNLTDLIEYIPPEETQTLQ